MLKRSDDSATRGQFSDNGLSLFRRYLGSDTDGDVEQKVKVEPGLPLDGNDVDATKTQNGDLDGKDGVLEDLQVKVEEEEIKPEITKLERPMTVDEAMARIPAVSDEELRIIIKVRFLVIRRNRTDSCHRWISLSVLKL